MAITFRILPELNVVYVKYVGRPQMADAMKLFDAYMAHPDCKPGQKHFVDLSEVTGSASDYLNAMKFMARMADQISGSGPQTLLVCYAPNGAGQKTAELGKKSWSVAEHMVYRIMDDEAAALQFLGLPVGSISEMLADA